jgi:hypothetical protein
MVIFVFFNFLALLPIMCDITKLGAIKDRISIRLIQLYLYNTRTTQNKLYNTCTYIYILIQLLIGTERTFCQMLVVR